MRVYYDQTGTITFTHNGLIAPPGDFIEVPDGDLDIANYKVTGGELVLSPKPVTSVEVNAERNRRIFSTFSFGGELYDCDKDSLARITGAATLAGFAVGAGSPVDYYLWHGGATPFVWITNSNSLTQMDAQTCFAFGQAAAVHQSDHIFSGDALKRQNPIPLNYTDDSHWR
jgi:hypothetical protein